MQEQLNKLRDIVTNRLRYSIRWTKVTVYAGPMNVYVRWSQPKGTEWRFHTVSFPVAEIYNYIERQENKLNNEIKRAETY